MDKILRNKKIISTRPAGKSLELTRLLEEKGARVLNLPTLKVVPRKLTSTEQGLLQNISQFNWVVFTSPNTVRYLTHNLSADQIEVLKGMNTAVVGKKTASNLREIGIEPTFINRGNTAKDLAIDLKPKLQKQTTPKVLFPAGNLALNELPGILEEVAEVTRIHVYNSEMPDSVDQKILDQLSANNYDLLIFASPSAVNNLMVLNPALKETPLKVACMGGTTAKMVENTGSKPLIIPEDSSVQGLVEAITNYYKKP